jgi:colanic acid/amylovoran biosynthesis glycosyltransferase
LEPNNDALDPRGLAAPFMQIRDASQVEAIRPSSIREESRPIIAVYAEPLLEGTMTFVRAQALSMGSFSPVFIGPRRAQPGLELPEQQVKVLHQNEGLWGKVRELPFKVFGYAPVFFRRVQRFHPVLMHAHFGPAALTALPMARWLGVPLVTTFHGYDATVSEKYLRRKNYRCAVYARRKSVLQESAQAFIAVSEFIRACIVEQGFPEEKIIVHYVGIDTNFFVADQSIKREPIVLMVARLCEQKGCEYLIQAMREVQTILPDAELVVIGDGPLRAALEQMAREYLGRFRYLGSQPPAVVREWMNRAKVFCVPSIRTRAGETEGFGMVFAEAQAMGLPVASFHSGGIPEAIEHGTTGLLAAEKDWRSLAENLLVLLRNESYWRRMSAAGPVRVRKYFNLSNQTKKIEEIYSNVIEEFRAGRP